MGVQGGDGERIFGDTEAFKIQRLGKNNESVSDKVTLFEHARLQVAKVFQDTEPITLTLPPKDVNLLTSDEYIVYEIVKESNS